MKNLTIVIGSILISTSCFAQSENLEKLSPENLKQACDAAGMMATSISGSHQLGYSKEDLLKQITEQEVTAGAKMPESAKRVMNDLMDIVYKQPVQKTNADKQKMAEQFGSDTYNTCIKNKAI